MMMETPEHEAHEEVCKFCKKPVDPGDPDVLTDEKGRKYHFDCPGIHSG
jgi:hypothetical protein